jgi:glycosyltransferase involved in cell wall biosynthesis
MKPAAGAWPGEIHILIPSFQSEGSLKRFLPELLNVVPATNIYVVDDGSTDDTGKCCNSLILNYLRHSENKGKGAALATGFAFLLERGAEGIITMDADGQHSVDDLPYFLEEFKAHPDSGIIIGCRSMKPGRMPINRICSNRLTSFILRLLTGVSILDSQCGFRLYSAQFLRRISIVYPRFEMESEVILKAAHLGFPINFVPIKTLYLKGTSHISHVVDTARWVKALIGIKIALRRSLREKL